MSILCKCITFAILLAICCVNGLIELDNEVLVLTDDNFDEALSTYESILIEFYAPWCGHCKTLAPEWSKAAVTLNKLSATTKLAKIDATENSKNTQLHGVKGFPTIKYFRGGKYNSEYSGGRSEADIVQFALKKSGPTLTTISNVGDLKSFEEKNSVFVIGLFSSISSENAILFSKHASEDDRVTFAYSASPEVLENYGVTSDSIIVIKDFDEGRADFEFTDDFNQAISFIVGHTTPLIQEFSAEASKKIFSSPITKHALVFTKKGTDKHSSVLATINPVAVQNRGRVLFVNVPSTESRILDFFGVPDSSLPAFILADMSSGDSIKKYYFSGDILNSEEISIYINSFFAGELKPSLKSEDLDPSDTEGPVTVVKGFSFEDLVINNSKDVFIEMYAPWCGHCKKLAPIWDELGQRYSSNPNIVIAKMDASSNEIDYPGVSVKGFPSLFFFKGSDKSAPVKYEGGRTLNEFISFLSENTQSVATIDDADARDEL